MFRHLLMLVLAWSLSSGLVQGQDIQRGKLKKLDVEHRLVVVTVNGKDREFTLTDQTQVLGATGKGLAERLKNFKDGADILFKPGRGPDQETLVGIKLVTGRTAIGRTGPPVSPDTTQLKPLTELGLNQHHGFLGGLYPEGSNSRPKSHEAAGLRLAQQVRPRNAAGQPAPDGKIVLLSIGMSNTSQSWQGFERIWAAQSKTNPQLLVVNGAQGGMTAAAIQKPDDNRPRFDSASATRQLCGYAVHRPTF